MATLPVMPPLPFPRLVSLPTLSNSGRLPRAAIVRPRQFPCHSHCSTPRANLYRVQNISQHAGSSRPSPRRNGTPSQLADPAASSNAGSTQSVTWKKISAFVDRVGASLDKLGATRTVKVVVIVFLSIFGTMETIFYIKAVTRWLWPPETDKGDD